VTRLIRGLDIPTTVDLFSCNTLAAVVSLLVTAKVSVVVVVVVASGRTVSVSVKTVCVA
jgi:hypothetical protein